MAYEAKNRNLRQWVQEVAELCRPDAIHWCDGSKAEYDRLMAQMVASRRGHPARETPEQFPVPLRPQRRRPRRGPHLHQHAEQGRGGPDQQLDRRGRAQAHDARPLRRLYARTDDVRHPLLDGPAGFADGQDRRRDHRQPLRRLQHADHDPGRRRRWSRRWARTASSCPACTRSAPRSSPARRTFPGPARRWRRSTSPTSRTRT